MGHFPSKFFFRTPFLLSLTLPQNNEGVWGFTQDKDGKLVREQILPLLIPGLKKIVSVSCGDNHALAMDSKGTVFGWGSGQQDQLGRRIVQRHAQKNLIPSSVPIPKRANIIDVQAGPNHNIAIDKSGEIYSWGLNNFAQTGIPYSSDEDNGTITAPTKVSALKDHKITKVGIGANHSVVLTDKGELYSYGRLENKALGMDTTAWEKDSELVRLSEMGRPSILLKPQLVPNPAGSKYESIACGPDHNIAITTEGKAFGWGFNANFQLGLGKTQDEFLLPTPMTVAKQEDIRMDWAGCGGQFSMMGSAMDTSE